jgi:hypothetical protein
MTTYYVLRRANGDILTLERGNQTYIAVWDSEVSVRRSKSSNPDLIVYVPAVVDRRWIERRFPGPRRYFLVDSSDADLATGREVTEEELFGSPEFRKAA